MVTRADVVRAACRIAGRVHRTPVLTSRTINALLGVEIHFKCENFATGSVGVILSGGNATLEGC